MPEFLPLRANVEWLKKAAKERLTLLQASDPLAKLSDAQFVVARDYGFPSWRAMIAHVEEVRDKLRALLPGSEQLDATPVPPTDPELGQLFAAIQSGDMPQVAGLLKQRPALARAHGADGQTPLHAAAFCNDPNLAVMLLAYGADPYAVFGESGHTALSWAAVCNAREFASTLVRLGARADFYAAAGMGALDLVQSFFDERGRLVEAASQAGSSRFSADGTRLPCPPESIMEQVSDALCIACRNGHADVVRFLLAKAPDLNFRAFMGATALHWAYFGLSIATIEMLMAAGADPTVRDTDLNCTPRAFGICAPASWGFLFLVQRQIAADKTLVNFTDGATTALHQAAQNGHIETVRFLVEQGADIEARDANGQRPVDLASARGHMAVAELLH